MRRIYKSNDGLLVEHNGEFFSISHSLTDLLSMGMQEARSIIEAASTSVKVPTHLVAPIDPYQEVWACGVTYLRSKVGRMEESEIPDLYSRVYDAERPEVFYKTVGWRVIPNGEPVGIRRDSGWDVPEAEAVLVVNSYQEIFGYTLGNDMSSRSIEGENTLYLPQAKSYEKSCTIGSFIIPSWEISEAVFPFTLSVERNGAEVFAGKSSSGEMKRGFKELVDWLFRTLPMPHGAMLFTGTGIVPSADFTLHEGDVVKIDGGVLGQLNNPVILVS
jgi:2-dehydro-3-deoxy-D-arabinonate dehydratase